MKSVPTYVSDAHHLKSTMNESQQKLRRKHNTRKKKTVTRNDVQIEIEKRRKRRENKIKKEQERKRRQHTSGVRSLGYEYQAAITIVD